VVNSNSDAITAKLFLKHEFNLTNGGVFYNKYYTDYGIEYVDHTVLYEQGESIEFKLKGN
jgi:hypothetical protein